MDGFLSGLHLVLAGLCGVYCRYVAEKERKVIQLGPDGWKVMQVRQRQAEGMRTRSRTGRREEA